MITVFLLGLLVGVCQALSPPSITGPTPPSVPCPNTLCKGKPNGNYEYQYYPNHFVQCVNEQALCQPCWPIRLEFSETCNQCLYKKSDECVTTIQSKPAVTYLCPDKCPDVRHTENIEIPFTGNIADPYNSYHYIACWKGATIGCVACPAGLKFNAKWNACLYDGLYKTKPESDDDFV